MDLDFEDEAFPYPNRITRDTFLKDLHVDPENPTQSIANIKEIPFDVDKFLYEHYRYSQLDELQKELKALVTELDQELFDMVNNDYFDFINLGKTLDGGEELVDQLRGDVSKYKKKLVDEDAKLKISKEHVERSLSDIKKLQQLKQHAQNMLLLDNFITKFETLLNQNKETIQIEVLKQLTSLYLTIHQIVASLPEYQFVLHKMATINILRYEFKAVLNEYLRGIRSHNASFKEVVDVLRIYSIIGDESTAVEVLKESKRDENGV